VTALLEVEGLTTRFREGGRVVHAVNGISYSLGRGEALALVGESGSGKSVSVLSLLGLAAPGRVEAGRVLFEGRDLLALSATELQRVRGRHIGMIFQDPSSSLNPVLTVGSQIEEGLREHLGLAPSASRRRAVELLAQVGIPDPEERLSDYPHEFSGGQRQRIMIAIALSCEPALLIADEPTTALDVTVQAQIVELLQGLRKSLGMAILWITHDLGLAAGLVDRVAVVYAGRIVEEARVRDLFRTPRHPYTRGLLQAMPRWDAPADEPLAAIPGAPPDLGEPIRACPFAPRCFAAVERCREEEPKILPAGPEQRVACLRSEEL
jgi:oligopeptide/dipeptide ABC transporter ATP-binding protein